MEGEWSIWRRLYATRLLRIAKRRAKYKYLEDLLRIDSTLLARYVSGLVIPGRKQAEKIIEVLEGMVDLEDTIKNAMDRFGGYIDLAPILSDPDLLFVAAYRLASRFLGEKVDKVLVPEASGISLATSMSIMLGAGLVLARRRKENPLVAYIEEHLVEPPNIRRSFYVRADLLNPGNKVLIVDDIVHSGLTLRLILRILKKIGASIVGVASIVVVGDSWRRHVEQSIRVESLHRVDGLVTTSPRV